MESLLPVALTLFGILHSDAVGVFGRDSDLKQARLEYGGEAGVTQKRVEEAKVIQNLPSCNYDACAYRKCRRTGFRAKLNAVPGRGIENPSYRRQQLVNDVCSKHNEHERIKCDVNNFWQHKRSQPEQCDFEFVNHQEQYKHTGVCHSFGKYEHDAAR